MELPDKLIAINGLLSKAAIPFAFGGAIALGFHGEPRATYDLDINIFLPPDQAATVLNLLDTLFTIEHRETAERRIREQGQVRLLWDAHYIDLFFQNFEFLESVQARAQTVQYRPGITIPIISAEDLILCKAAFNRGKDWLDIRMIFAMRRERLDHAYLRHWLIELLGPESESATRVFRYFADYPV